MNIPYHKVIVNGECIGSYNTIQEISEKVIESLGKSGQPFWIDGEEKIKMIKKIYIEEVETNEN